MSQSNDLLGPAGRDEQGHSMLNDAHGADQLVESILDKIAANQVGDALQLFKQKDENLAFLLDYYWKRIEHERRHGLITPDEAIHETNDLVYRLLTALEGDA